MFVSIARTGTGVILTVTEAFSPVSVAPVAFTVTAVSVLTAGAVNLPVLEMVPALADQSTPVSLVPVMLAVNCSVPSEATVALLGEIVMWDFFAELSRAATTLMCTIPEPCSPLDESETDRTKV